MLNKIQAILENRKFDNFLELMACRVFGRDTGLTVYRLKDWRILVDHKAGDQNGTKACLVTPMYRDFFKLISMPDKPAILDVGGNGGGFVLLCAQEFGELGAVVSLEFNPDTYRRLWYNLKSNISHDIVVINGAAAGENGTLRVRDCKGSTSDKPAEMGGGEPGIDVELVTLDHLVKGHYGDDEIDLCKIDIEGSEFEFLLSEEATRLKQIRNLIIEIHPVDGRKPSDLEGRFEECGFELKAKADETHGDVRLYVRKDG